MGLVVQDAANGTRKTVCCAASYSEGMISWMIQYIEAAFHTASSCITHTFDAFRYPRQFSLNAQLIAFSFKMMSKAGLESREIISSFGRNAKTQVKCRGRIERCLGLLGG